MEEKEIKKAIREGYARIARKEGCAPAELAVEISQGKCEGRKL